MSRPEVAVVTDDGEHACLLLFCLGDRSFPVVAHGFSFDLEGSETDVQGFAGSGKLAKLRGLGDDG